MITKQQYSDLESLGISSDTEEGAKKEILEKLKDFGVDGLDDDPLQDLIDILTAFLEIDKPIEKKTIKIIDDFKKEDLKKLETEKENKSIVLFDGRRDDHKEKVESFLSYIVDPEICYIVKQSCIPFFLKGSVSGRSLFIIENLRFRNGKLDFSVIYTGMNLMKDGKANYEFLQDNLEDDYSEKIKYVGEYKYLALKKMTKDDLKYLLNDKVITFIKENVKKLEKKLNQNRKRIEDSM